MLLDTPEIMLKICPILNPATLVPEPNHHTSMPEHEYSKITDLVYSSRPGLKESPIDNADDKDEITKG